MSAKRATNIFLMALIIGFSVWVIYESAQFPTPNSPEIIGPARFPMMAAFLLCLVGIILFLNAIRDGGVEVTGFISEAKAPFVLVVLCICFILATQYIGFPIAGLIWFFIAAFFLGRRWRTSLLAAVILVSFIYVVFHTILSVPLP